MTVENDGLSPGESAAHEPTNRDLQPVADMLPLDGATARKVAASDAAARQAEMNAPPQPAAPYSEPTPPTEPLPLGTPPAGAVPGQRPATHVEGDLFDDPNR